MERWIGKVAVVTGASSGIGLATVKALIKEGMNVVGLARRKLVMEDEMRDVQGRGTFYPIECDISNETNVISTFRDIRTTFGTVHVLVNNAGIALSGKIIDQNRALWDKAFGVNVMGVLQCSQQCIKMMNEEGNEGHIVNLNSTQGHRVYNFPNIDPNIYPATKHALTAITKVLQNELKGKKIKVTSVSPGFVKTNILITSGQDTTDWDGLDPEDVANAIVSVIATPPHVQIMELSLNCLRENTGRN